MRPGIFTFSADDVWIMPSPVKPIAGFEYPKDFPRCCGYHSILADRLNEWFTAFPDSCDECRNVSQKPWFRKETFANLPEKILDAFVFACYFIEQRINNENYLKDIIDYVDYLMFNFGNPPVGIGQFSTYLIDYLSFRVPANLPKDRVATVLNRLTGQDAKPKEVVNTDFELLEDTYCKWLNAFPFGIEVFQQYKAHLGRQMPYLSGEMQHNPYTGLSKSRMCSTAELIALLNSLTKHLLQSVDSTKLLAEGVITDTQKQRVDLANEAHRIRQQVLFADYSEEETHYVTTIRTWLENEKAYFQEMQILMNPASNASVMITVGNDSVVQYQAGSNGSAQTTSTPKATGRETRL